MANLKVGSTINCRCIWTGNKLHPLSCKFFVTKWKIFLLFNEISLFIIYFKIISIANKKQQLFEILLLFYIFC